MAVVWIKIWVAVLAAVTTLASLGLAPALHRRCLGRVRRWDVPLLWAACRLTPFLLVYVFGGFRPESDVATCFWPQATGALAGHFPYRDFESFFGPLFPYLLALPVAVWHDPRAIILGMSIAEAATIALTTRFAGLEPNDVRRTRFLLCSFLSPASLLLSIIGGQEDFLLWTFGLLAWLAVRRGRESVAIAWCATAMLATKAVFVLPLAALVSLSRQPVRFVTALVVVGAATAALLWHCTGSAFLSVLSRSGNISPPQVWLILHLLTGGLVPAGAALLSFVVLAGALAAAMWSARRLAAPLRSDPRLFASLWVALFAAFIVLSPKSQGAYFDYILLPALLIVSDRPKAIVVWLVTGAIAAVLPSIFYRVGQPHPTRLAELRDGWAWANVALQIAGVAGLLGLAVLATQGVRGTQPPATTSPAS